MWSDHSTMAMGPEAGPVSPSNYKRAVLKPPPREFTVEVLSPAKQGSNFSYGLKVCPIFRSRQSSDSRSTASSYSEYEIWRRWEDCLGFQETLEAEYSQMSRQKVKVLKRGGKKRSDDRDAPYTLHNAAASFESLPEGPDPREVAVDVHKLIPQLTRKGTLFRVSRSTVNQRGDEFAAMIHALFDSSDDAPVLLQELRNCPLVRDFFGFWRRDKELLKKSGKDVSRLFHPNRSMSSLSTAFSLSSNPSSPASSTFPTTPTSPTVPLRHSMFMRLGPRGSSEYSRDRLAPGPPMPASAPPGSRKFVSSPVNSQFSVSSRHDRLTEDTDTAAGSMLFTDELLLQDDPGSNTETATRRRPVTHFPAPRSAPLQGSHEMQSQVHRPHHMDVSYPIPEDELPRPLPRARSNSSAAPGYRNARIFVSAPNSPIPPLKLAEDPRHDQLELNTPSNGHAIAPPSMNPNRHMSHLLSPVSSQSSSHSASLSSRPSSMSMNRFSVTSSISSYTQSTSKRSSSSHDSQRSFDSESCVDLELAFPSSPIVLHTPLSEIVETRDPGLGHHSRDSASSFASCRTEASAEGVLPLHLRSPPERRKRSISRESRANNTTPMMDSRAPGLVEESMSESGDDLIDSYFDDPADKLAMETLDKELPRFISHRGKHSISSVSSAGSFITNESQPSLSPRDEAFAVKAVYHESVVVFRAERSMSLATIRQRIRQRFALHEGIPLNEDFVLAYLPSRIPVVKGGVTVRRGRSNSAASSTADVSQLRLLQTEVDWQSAMTTCGGKVTLRVLDAATPF